MYSILSIAGWKGGFQKNTCATSSVHSSQGKLVENLYTYRGTFKATNSFQFDIAKGWTAGNCHKEIVLPTVVFFRKKKEVAAPKAIFQKRQFEMPCYNFLFTEFKRHPRYWSDSKGSGFCSGVYSWIWSWGKSTGGKIYVFLPAPTRVEGVTY